MPGGHVLTGKVVCVASCYQPASESLVKVIASEPCSGPVMLLGDRIVLKRGMPVRNRRKMAVRNIK